MTVRESMVALLMGAVVILVAQSCKVARRSSQESRCVCKISNRKIWNGFDTYVCISPPPTTIPPSTVTVSPPTFHFTDIPVGPVTYHIKGRYGERRRRSVALACGSRGWPRPEIYWRHDGHRLTGGLNLTSKYSITESIDYGGTYDRYGMVSTLTVRNINKWDYGMYQCVGRNYLGLTEIQVELYEVSGVNSDKPLTLRDMSSKGGQCKCKGYNALNKYECHPDPLSTAPPLTLTDTSKYISKGEGPPVMYPTQIRFGQRRGRSQTLSCTAIGSPRPEIYWMRHGHRLTNNFKYDVRETEVWSIKTTSTLMVRSISRRDYGAYQCMGVNNNGRSEIDVVLFDNTRSKA